MILRGEIWWASLPKPRGPEPGYRRPVLVVQSDVFNRSAISTVLVAAITSHIRLANAPVNVPLSRRESGLPRDSVVNVSQLLTLDKRYLLARVRNLPAASVREVDAGLRHLLSL